MKTKLVLIAVTAITFVLGISSCAPYVDPRHQYPPHYRTYQDRHNGGQDGAHGGINTTY